MRKPDVLAGARLLFLFVWAGAGTTSFAQRVYQGLTPGLSTRDQVNAALGAPVRQVQSSIDEHAPQQGTGPIHVEYSPAGLVNRIQVFFLQPIARSVLVEQVLNNQYPEMRRFDPAGALVEFFGEPALSSLHYAGGDQAKGAGAITYYSRDTYLRHVGPVTAQAPSAAPGPAGLSIAADTEFRVRLLSAVDTRKSRQGDRISAEVLAPEAYAGDAMDGQVRESKGGAPIAGTASLAITFETLHHRGEDIPVQANVKSVINSRGVQDADEEGRLLRKQNRLGAAALSTGVGAIIGALAGGGRGAAIGAGAGAAGSVAVIELATEGAQFSLASGSQLILTLRANSRAGAGTQTTASRGTGATALSSGSRTPVNININLGVPGRGGVTGGTPGVTSPAGGAIGDGRNLARNRPARQSSVHLNQSGNQPQGGVDGVKNGGVGFHTSEDPRPWWEVDLGSSYALGEVRLFNRLDCCAERARNVQVLLSQDDANWQNVYTHNGSIFGGNDGKPLSVPLNGLTARFVRLQLADSNYFHLDEVEVYGVGSGSSGAPPFSGSTPAGAGATTTTFSAPGAPVPAMNLALNRPAQQSSVYDNVPANDARGGVDGVKNGGLGFATKYEPNPWWQVDLGGTYSLTEVRIFNRLDCCSDRIKTLQVLLSADGTYWQSAYTHSGSVFGGADGRPLSVPIGGRSARFVRVQLAEANYLNLDEVEVYGVGSGSSGPPPFSGSTPAGVGAATTTTYSSPGAPIPTMNLALNRPARQSSVYDNFAANDARAGVDGVITGKIGFATGREANPWWQVDLGAVYDLAEIRLYNRLDCCSDRVNTLQLLLSQDGASWQSAWINNGTIFGGADGHPLSIRVTGRRARFVRLQLNETNYLNLEEVEVYGTQRGPQ